MTITFDNNLITGNETIDTQHKELIDRIQQFVTACESGDGKIKAIKMLDYLDYEPLNQYHNIIKIHHPGEIFILGEDHEH